MPSTMTEQHWDIRLFIYQFLVENDRPPTMAESAAKFGLCVADIRKSFHWLHRNHQIVLEPGTESVRIAVPLSAVPTAYRVEIDGKLHYANCAWDSLGIPAMLHRDATIEAHIDDASVPVRYAIENGSLVAPPGLAIHFPMPIPQWLDNLADT